MRLVIDANIAQSAGSSNDPESLNSRECLNAVLEHEHIAVFGQPLRDEWREHSSLHSRRWWRSMMARKRVEFQDGAEFAVHLESSCACLEHDRWKQDLRKDFHLVQSALASGQTILSNEREFPKYVSIACVTVRILSGLYYANPSLEGESCIQWIQAGAQNETGRRIEAWVRSYCTAN